MKHINAIIQAEIRKQVEDQVDHKLSQISEPQFFLTRPEAAAFCRTSLTNFDRWVKEDKVRGIKVDGRKLFSRHWLIDDLQKMQSGTGLGQEENAG